MKQKTPSLFDWKIAGPAIGESFGKLNPRLMVRNPVMFVTMVGAALTTVGIFTAKTDRGFIVQLAVWLWFTVLFANFAEAVAEGRGKAQAASLRKARKETMARRLHNGLILAIICCGIYPLAVFGVSKISFRDKANGSLIVDQSGAVRGSRLIGQNFSSPKYFHPRPSAAGNGYDATSSGGSNLGPTSQKLNDAVKERIESYRKENGLKNSDPVPARPRCRH